MTKQQAHCLEQALVQGFALLKVDGPSVEAVEAAIRVLESSGLFNAGSGSNRQLDHVQRMDASIMEGAALKAGAVASIEGIMHPITAARLVMQQTSHVLLVGDPATRFAQYFHMQPQLRSGPSCRQPPRRVTARGVATVRLYQSLIRRRSARRRSHGKETVGAVALDRAGTVAAGASTGGVDVMLPGRVGDTPLIGCGVYADNQAGAISMTGFGEAIIRIAVAKEIANLLEQGRAPSHAAAQVLKKLTTRTKGAAGALVLTSGGRFAITHVTPRMSAGSWDGTRMPIVRDRFL